ncbi:hypothetical protein [Pseudomonas sp. NCCP-436]|uniref:hypothetical protein n=1 Tax=Pseudomonas sp. NCCP-436 TaxID=2842481 RepID=UPI001C811FAA|nr:hypothetical protein [Pseudomonas sp. NCCP-436]
MKILMYPAAYRSSLSPLPAPRQRPGRYALLAYPRDMSRRCLPFTLLPVALRRTVRG